MSEPPRPRITRDTVQRIAREQAGLALTDANADTLVELVNGLQAYAAAVVARPRDGVEPEVTAAAEDWTHG